MHEWVIPSLSFDTCVNVIAATNHAALAKVKRYDRYKYNGSFEWTLTFNQICGVLSVDTVHIYDTPLDLVCTGISCDYGATVLVWHH